MPSQADSDRSWTVDIAERKRIAAEQSTPLKERSEELLQEARALRNQLTALRKTKQQDTEEYTEIEQAAKELEKEGNELKAQAKAIDDAVYDLKAVNPNAKNEEDARTPDELLNFIRAKGREADELLDILQFEKVSKVTSLEVASLNGKAL